MMEPTQRFFGTPHDISCFYEQRSLGTSSLRIFTLTKTPQYHVCERIYGPYQQGLDRHQHEDEQPSQAPRRSGLEMLEQPTEGQDPWTVLGYQGKRDPISGNTTNSEEEEKPLGVIPKLPIQMASFPLSSITDTAFPLQSAPMLTLNFCLLTHLGIKGSSGLLIIFPPNAEF